MKKRIGFTTYYIFLSLSMVAGIFAAPKGWTIKKELLRDRNHPAMRAFLDTIAYAEGTYHDRLRGYQMRYPLGETFEGFEAHPARVGSAYCGKKEICSTAAGRYMFLEKTWKTIAERLDLDDFSPLNQDIAALYLIRERRAIDDIKNGNLRSALDKVKEVWASLPGSPYQQPVKKYEILRKVFSTRYSHYKKYLRERGMR